MLGMNGLSGHVRTVPGIMHTNFSLVALTTLEL